jgi:diaminopimelate epimerase
MKFKFTKMHGAGNDFIVIDGISQAINLSAVQWRHLADRRFGIGADQILVVEKSDLDGVDFRYRIFNADGGEVEQCGNGARAFARFVTDQHLTTKTTIKVATMSGIISPTMEADGNVSVDMGAPVFNTAQIPFDATGLAPNHEANETLWPLMVNRKTALVSVVSMGNPHAVQIVDSVELADVLHDGPAIECDPRFPKRVNAGFMQIVDRHHVRLRVHERGAGETLACGTGACAAVVAGIRRGRLDSPVEVDMRGGVLGIAWNGGASAVILSGPAVTVFEGEITV